jgi:taurine dioxygenase
MPIEVVPFPGGFGAEVCGFDGRQPIGESNIDSLKHRLFEHQVLVFRNQDLSVAQQVQLTCAFGEIETVWDSQNVHPDDNRVQIVSNIGRKDADYKTSSQYWHTDRSFVQRPTMLTFLHSRQLPRAGGDTLFTDTCRAYEGLPASIRLDIDSLRASHSFSFRLSELRSKRYSTVNTEFEEKSFPDVTHPLVRTHPFTGRKALYLNELCINGVIGYDKEASDSLLTYLYAHTLRPEFIYEHKWEKGDLLVWDNPSLMHRGTTTPIDTVRILYRTTTEGGTPY